MSECVDDLYHAPRDEQYRQHAVDHHDQHLPRRWVVPDDVAVHRIGVHQGIEDVLGVLTQYEGVGSFRHVAPRHGRGGQVEVAARVRHLTRVHVSVGIEVAHHKAAESPFITEDLGEQAVVAARPARAYAVERAHQSARFRFLHRYLEGTQAQLAQRLFGQPGQVAVTRTWGRF